MYRLLILAKIGASSLYPVFRAQNRINRTIAQTITQPIHVTVGWSACHSRIFLWMSMNEILPPTIWSIVRHRVGSHLTPINSCCHKSLYSGLAIPIHRSIGSDPAASGTDEP